MIFRNRNVWYSFPCTQQALAQILLPILACLLLPSPPHWPLALPPSQHLPYLYLACLWTAYCCALPPSLRFLPTAVIIVTPS